MHEQTYAIATLYLEHAEQIQMRKDVLAKRYKRRPTPQISWLLAVLDRARRGYLGFPLSKKD